MDRLLTAYDLYKFDWCQQRGYNLTEVQAAYDRDEEYNGEMFVCLNEFEDYEYQDEGYVKYLFEEMEVE